ncbi:MAG TPA: histidinol-phosphate transaminase [Candidatus Deferrimicrobium sp.]|nr:histidinol-phosphate transaminase [Candidatus Deferrimicrobium sp.]
MITIPEHIATLAPYEAGKPISELARTKNLMRIIKLASNENPLGPSPKALAAIEKAVNDLHRYVNPAAPELVRAVSRKYHVTPQRIICGHGTDALLSYIVTALSEPGDEVLTSEGSFIGMYVGTLKQGRRLRKIPLKNYAFNLDAIATAISPRTRIVYLANPNNPTGTMFGAGQFESFMAEVPRHVLVVLDEAYFTYALEHPNYPDGITYEYDNLIVTRSLSKAYGLAGIRVGLAVGPEDLIRALYKVKLPFEPNSLAQAAAVAALDDDDFLRLTVQTNTRNLSRMRLRFDELGIRQVETVADFILLLMPSEEFAETFFARCLDQGLIVRHVKSFGIPNGIRLNSGTDEETTVALDIIEQVWTEMTAETVGAESTVSAGNPSNETRFIQNSRA